MNTTLQPDTETLPIEIGFTEDHLLIQNELILRIVSLLQQGELEVTAASAAKDWSGNFEESIQVNVGKLYKLQIALKTMNKP